MKANKINALVLTGALLLTSTGGSYAGQKFSTLKGMRADMTGARFNNVTTITLPSQRDSSVAETSSTRIGGVDVRYQTEVPAALTTGSYGQEFSTLKGLPADAMTTTVEAGDAQVSSRQFRNDGLDPQWSEMTLPKSAVSALPDGAAVALLPFMDDQYRLLVPEVGGGFSLLYPFVEHVNGQHAAVGAADYGVRQARAGELDWDSLEDAQSEHLQATVDADIVITGEFEERENEEDFILHVSAVRQPTGETLATATVTVPSAMVAFDALEGVTIHTIPASNGWVVSSLPMTSLANIYASPRFRVPWPPRGARGPKGGWGGSLRRALERDDESTTTASTAPKRLSSFPRPEEDTDNLDDDGDDPRDTPPPNYYGEEIDSEQVCRVKLQCQLATSLSRQFAALPLNPLAIIAGNQWPYHCGWYTHMSNASPPRLGFHVQSGDPDVSFLAGRVLALIFESDRGFKELSITFRFTLYDSLVQEPQNSCEIAECVRKNAWNYAAIGDRPYQLFGQGKPNSNSFIGAIARACEIEDPDFPEDSDASPRKPRHRGCPDEGCGARPWATVPKEPGDEKRFPGWNYWSERSTGGNEQTPVWETNRF